MKKYRITSPMKDLSPVMTGLKTHSVRFDQRLDGIAPGDQLTIAFGAYNAPTLVVTSVARVVRVDVSALLEHEYDMTPWESDQAAEDRFDYLAEHKPLELFEQLETQPIGHAELLQLCKETDHNPFDIMARADETERPLVFGIWWNTPSGVVNNG